MKRHCLPLLALVTLLTGCATSTTPPLTITRQDHNRTFTVPAGTEITVRLAANPTTGYAWEFMPKQSTPVLTVNGESFQASQSDLLGAPGETEFHVTAAAPGNDQIRCRYFRPWEKFTPGQDTELRFHIIVTP